jgi:hypothetical protein
MRQPEYCTAHEPQKATGYIARVADDENELCCAKRAQNLEQLVVGRPADKTRLDGECR